MYSTPLRPRNTSASRTERPKKSAVFRPSPREAWWSPVATVNELVTSTSVLTKPIQVSIDRLASANASP